MTIDKAYELHEDPLQYQYQLQAKQVQKVLDSHGRPATVVGGSVSQRSTSLNLQSHVTGGLQRLRDLHGTLKKALGVENIRLLNDSGELQLQVIRPFEPAVPLLDLLRLIPEVPPASAVLGLTEDGSPILHTFSAQALPHILISGEEDAGKTILLRTIAASLVMTSNEAQIQLMAINPISGDRQRYHAQESALRPLNYLPHMLTDVAVRQTEIMELLFFLVREMNFRMEHDFAFPRIVVLIDQAATLMEHGGRTIVDSLQRLAQQGADAGIHLVLSTRRPDASVIYPHLSNLLQSRYIGRQNIMRTTENETHPTNIEATTLLGKGDFLTADSGCNVRFQAAYIGDSDLHLSLSRRYLRQPILLAQPQNKPLKMGQVSQMSHEQTQQFSFVDGLISAG